jgi:glutamate-ammonia-ligase adenylyltransferase
MRLRPSGNQGPVATSWNSFQDYQRNDAWVWEHLALTRAEVLAGSEDLAKDVETVRSEVIQNPRDTKSVLLEVAKMRARIASSKPPESIWDPKIGGGRMQDIELFAQTGALLSGTNARETEQGLRACVAVDLINDADRQVLQASYEMCWTLQLASRLLSQGILRPTEVGDGAMGFICRAMGYEDLITLELALTDHYLAAKEVIDKIVGTGDVGGSA